MTSPAPLDPVTKANWLGRYLEVEKKAAAELNAVLEQAERNIADHLKNLTGDNFSTGVRRAQLNLSMQQVRKTLKDMFGQTADIIRNKQGEAAVAAVDAGLFDERGVLSRLFKNPGDRQKYANSLRETAKRNIQSTMTRVLETEQPLSDRVWKTNALARGYVSKAVNNALARGESAENLAKEVRGLVRPSTPGGVSYAAKRLARTEINNAFHAQSIHDAEEHPWISEMRWQLSKVHKSDPGDECEQYALIGLFDKNHVPDKPHPNCFSGETLVTAQSVRSVSKRWYEGRFIDVFCAEDTPQLSGTPNHPALTKRGWVPLSELREGDYLVVNPLWDNAPGLSVPNQNYVKTRIEDIFEAFRMSFNVTAMSVPGATKQFHGDGIVGENIDVVLTDSLLQNGWDSKGFSQGAFLDSGMALLDFFGFSSGSETLVGIGHATSSSMGGRRSRFALRGSHIGSGLKIISQIPSTTLKHLSNLHSRPPANIGRFFQSPSSNVDFMDRDSILESPESRASFGISGQVTSKISFVRVERVVARPMGFTGHVYNLSTESGWYTVDHSNDSAVVSNCRCFVTPELLDYDTFESNLLMGHYSSYIDSVIEGGHYDSADRIIDFSGIVPPGVKKAGPDLSVRPKQPKLQASDVIPAIDAQDWRSSTNVTALGYRFEKKWPNIFVQNFKEENIALEDGKQLLGAVDDMLTKYPQAQGNLKTIVLGYGPDDEYARTIREPGSGYSTIKFNLSWARDHDAFYSHVASNVADTFHPPNTQVNPYYDMTIHEFGHVLDNVGQQRARDNASQIAKEFYSENIKKRPEMAAIKDFPETPEGFDMWRIAQGKVQDSRKRWDAGYSKWLIKDGAPSRYSINNILELSPHESLAEAFLDVERNGDKAKPLSKVLRDKLIEESKQPKTPKSLLDLDINASGSSLARGDYKPNPVDIKDFIDVPNDRGRWNYRETYDARNEGPMYQAHDFTIEPAGYPESRSFTETLGNQSRIHTIFFDPKETEVTPGQFGFDIARKEVALEDTVKAPEGMLWRGMSSEEYQLARKRGYFESIGEYNVGGQAQEGKSYFSTDIAQAGHYATWYAPPQFKPTFEHPGYVIGIPDRPSLLREQGTEVGVPGKIPFKEVQNVYVAKPYAISPGTTSVSEDYNGWTRGGGVQPSVRVAWSEIVGPQEVKIQSLEPEIYKTVRANGGVTIDLGGKQPADGFAYAFKKSSEVAVPEGDWTQAHLDRFIENHIDELNLPGNNLGVWVQDGYVYMDVSRVGSPTAETIAEAQKAHQLAVFDLDQFKEIQIGTIDEKGRYTPNGQAADLVNQYREQIFGADQGRSSAGGSTLLASSRISPERKELKLLPDKRLDVKWDGPTVAKPLDYYSQRDDRIINDINNVWQSVDFDDYKGEIRKGAQQLETKGWRGFDRKVLVDTEYEHDVLPVTGKALRETGKEIAARAIYADNNVEPLFRGMVVTPEDAALLTQEGQRISLPLSSFTEDQDVATMFSTRQFGWQSKETRSKSVPVVMQLEPGAKTAYIDNQESVAFGKFQVMKVINPTDLSEREQWSLADLINIGVSELADPELAPKVVVIRQYSLKEAVRQADLVAKSTEEIPDITFLGDPKEMKRTGVAYLDDAREFLKKSKGIDFTGFTPSQQLDVNVVDEAVGAVDTLTKKFPDAIIGEFGFGKMDESMGGYTEIVEMNWNTGEAKSRVVLNDKISRDYEEWKKEAERAVKEGFHYVGSDEKPIESTVFHEFGHVISNMLEVNGLKLADSDVESALYYYWHENLWPKVAPEIENLDIVSKAPMEKKLSKIKSIKNIRYNDWVDQLSDYSFHNGNFMYGINGEEAAAEAFEVVERLGDSAPEPARVIYNMLIDEYKKRVVPIELEE